MLLRIRFHGRGGHGVKTAARIVGTAAFLGGYQAQDSSMFGAERRGAAVTASVRISNQQILERGPIAAPDLIVLADETLLRDASAGVLRGQEGASAIFINAQEAVLPPNLLLIQPRMITWDICGLTRRVLGRATALSAGLAAAVARLTGVISRDALQKATQEELEALELPRAARLLPVAPEFAEMLLAVPQPERTGPVFVLPGIMGGTVTDLIYVSRVVGKIGEAAGVKVDERTKKDVKVVKFASAHDFRRAFGVRWASRVMPADLMKLMRHADISTTME